MNNYSTPADSDYRVQSLRNDVVNAHLQLAHATKQYSDSILRFMDGMNSQSHDSVYKILQSFPLPTFTAPDNFLQHSNNGSIPVPYSNGHQHQQQHQHQQPQPQQSQAPTVPPLTQAQVSGDKPNPYFSTVTPYQPKKVATISAPAAATPTLKRKATTEDDEDADEDKKAKKAKKAAKDPNAPKRPASAYLLYQNAIRESVKKEAGNEAMSHKDLTKKIGEKWGELSQEARQPYADAAKKAMDIWNREKEQYKVDHPEGGDPAAAPVPKKRGRKSNAERAQLQADAADAVARQAATASAQAGQQVPLQAGSGSINPAATFNVGPKGSAAPAADSDDSDESSSDEDEAPAAPAAAPAKEADDSSDTDDTSSDDDDAARRAVAPTPAKSKASQQQPVSIAPSLTQKSKHQPAPLPVVTPEKKKKKSKKTAAA